MPPWRSFAAAAVVLGVVVGALTFVLYATDEDEPRAFALARPGPPLGAGSSARPGRRSRSASASSSSATRRRSPTGCGRRVAWRRTRPSAGGRPLHWRVRSSSLPSSRRKASTRGPTCSSHASSTASRQWPIRAPSCCSSALRVWQGSTRCVPRSPRRWPRRPRSPAALPAAPAAFRGTGITVALLDTAVDPATPYLHGRVSSGFDVLDGGAAARYDQRPGGDRLETHGTATAGIVAGLGRPGGPRGVAPDVTVLPIRVAGWQRDAAGRWSIHGRTDQIIAGLERAVDPNRRRRRPRCCAHRPDPARRAVLGVPGQRARPRRLRRGRARLARRRPGGERRPGGPGFGSIGGPGGAPDALTAGAADLRPSVLRGLGVVPGRPASAAPPASRSAHVVGAARRSDVRRRRRTRTRAISSAPGARAASRVARRCSRRARRRGARPCGQPRQAPP